MAAKRKKDYFPNQTHVPLKLRQAGDVEAIELLFGPDWRWRRDAFNTQTHIPFRLRNMGDVEAIELIYGEDWRMPKFETDIATLERLHGPPPVIRTFDDFRPYQRWMVEEIKRQPAVLLGAEMGLGKTGACLKAFVDMLDEGVITKPLVIAPLRVTENTWPEEMAVWDFTRDKTYSVISGDEDQRIAAVRQDADFYFINRENFVWLCDYLPGRAFDFDALIYDEASRLKAGMKKTKPTKRKNGTLSDPKLSEFGHLAKKRYKFKKIAALTGTPTPNGIKDLWGPMYILDKGERLGRSKTAFYRRWFSYNKWTHEWKPMKTAEAEILREADDIFHTLKSSDYVSLPPLVPVDHLVRLPAKAQRAYDRLERDMVLEDPDVEAVNNGVLTGKLLQLANGSLYVEDGPARAIHDTKLSVLESIMEEACGAPVLVAYSFRFDIDRILKRFPYARLFGEHDDDKRDWDAGRIRMLVTHPASAGHGLNFQHGGNIMVWYGMTWSLELYQQFNKRLHRPGQKSDHVMMHRIMARGTVDEDVLAVLRKRDQVQERIKDAVKADMNFQSDFNAAVRRRVEKIRSSA